MRVVLVPGVLALLPEYAGLVDPVADLRAACLDAVAWLVEEGAAVTVLADAQGARVADALLEGSLVVEQRASASVVETPEGKAGLEGAGFSTRSALGGPAAQPPGAAYLVVANGSARRTEKAPGHLDERSIGFDEMIEKALCGPDPETLATLDPALGADLLAGNVEGLRALGDVLTPGHEVSVDYADDPFGVQYWVMRWQCES